MEIDFEEVDLQTRFDNIDVVGNHEKNIARERTGFWIIVVTLAVVFIIVFSIQKENYDKKLAMAKKNNE